MKESTTTYVGLDVHKDSIVVAIAEGGREHSWIVLCSVSVCGRFFLYRGRDPPRDHFGLEEASKTRLPPRLNVAISGGGFAVRERGEGRLKLSRLCWVLIPRYAKTAKFGYRTIKPGRNPWPLTWLFGTFSGVGDASSQWMGSTNGRRSAGQAALARATQGGPKRCL